MSKVRLKKERTNKDRPKPKKFALEQIDELKFMLIIIKPELEKQVSTRLEELGGRVLLSKLGEGISKNKSLELLGIQTNQSVLIFACARKEDADNMLVALNLEFNFTEPGNGLGLTIDCDGYMGTKGLFV